MRVGLLYGATLLALKFYMGSIVSQGERLSLFVLGSLRWFWFRALLGFGGGCFLETSLGVTRSKTRVLVPWEVSLGVKFSRVFPVLHDT